MIKFEPMMDLPDGEADTRKARILFFLGDQAQSPDQRAVVDTYFSALAHRDDLDITLMTPNGGDYANRARDAGYRLFPLSDFSRSLLRRTPQLWPILTAMRRHSFDIALTHDGFAARGLKQVSRRVIGVCHDDQFQHFAGADDVIAFSSSAADQAMGILEDDVRVHSLPNPYACRYDGIKPLPRNQPLTIGAAGPLEPEQGLGSFLHIAQLVHQECPDVKFVIAGDGSEEHDLKELADHIAPFVEFTGALSFKEMGEQFDIYCQTSRQEAFGFTLCEMMDAGLPCLSTVTHGPMDILKGGMVGPLLPIDDAFAFAQRLIALIEDRASLEAIKQACFARVREEDFSYSVFSKRLIDILTSQPRS
ncbi:MAG: glycosyltransferase [Cohaesibacter sp.]|nr:glycosyltransferase [Cohaesibacter sp.]